MENTVKVFIIEENSLLRQRTAAFIMQTVGLEVAGMSDNLAQGVEDVKTLQPAVILLDVTTVKKKMQPLITKLCHDQPRTMVVCMKESWNEEEVKEVLAAGACGYLFKPFAKEQLVKVLTGAYRQKTKTQQQNGKVIALFTPKGSYGKSTLIVNAAIGLSQESGKKVGIVDANLQFGDIAVFLNITPRISIFEAARDLSCLTPGTLSNYFTVYNPHIKLLAAPLKPEQGDLLTGGQIAATVKMAQQLFPYIIVDTPAGFNDISLSVTEAADLVYVVCAINTGLELNHLRRCLDYFKELGYGQEKIRVLINRVPQRSLWALRTMEKKINYPIVTLLPNDFNLAVTASNQGLPMMAVEQKSGLVRGLLDMVKNIMSYDGRTDKLGAK